MSLEKLEREVAARLRPLPRAPPGAQAPRIANPSRLGKGGGAGARRRARRMGAPTARASRAMDGHVRRLAKARSAQFVDLLRGEFTKLPAAEDGSVLGRHLLRGLRNSRGVSRALAAHGKAARQGGARREEPAAAAAAAAAAGGDPFLAYPALLALLGDEQDGGVRVTWARVLRMIGNHGEPAAAARRDAPGEGPPVRERGGERGAGANGVWGERRGGASAGGSPPAPSGGVPPLAARAGPDDSPSGSSSGDEALWSGGLPRPPSPNPAPAQGHQRRQGRQRAPRPHGPPPD